jgi:hypothetical protein
MPLRQLLTAFLIGRLEADDRVLAQCQMFGLATADAATPELETGALHGLAHQFDHLRLRDAELGSDGIESGAVFPSHLDDAVDVVTRECGDAIVRGGRSHRACSRPDLAHRPSASPPCRLHAVPVDLRRIGRHARARCREIFVLARPSCI